MSAICSPFYPKYIFYLPFPHSHPLVIALSKDSMFGLSIVSPRFPCHSLNQSLLPVVGLGCSEPGAGEPESVKHMQECSRAPGLDMVNGSAPPDVSV